jgi:hypothetical protein
MRTGPPHHSLRSSRVPPSDSTPPPTPYDTQAFWYPRVRGALTVVAGTLAYGALATSFGTDLGFGSALVGLAGSLAMMVIVWKLEARRAEKYHGRTAVATGPAATGPGATGPGTT